MSNKPFNNISIRLEKTFIELFFDALSASAELFKIIIPISIVTRFLQQWGRLLFSLVVVLLLARLVKVLPQSVFDRYLVRCVKGAPVGDEVRCC